MIRARTMSSATLNGVAPVAAAQRSTPRVMAPMRATEASTAAGWSSMVSWWKFTTNRLQTWRIARPFVLAEIGDRLVIGNKPPRQPHDLHVAPGLALKPSARLDPVQITVNIKLQEDRRMIGGSPCRLRIEPAKIERTEIKRVDKHVNYTNRVVLVDPIIQAFGKQRRD